jgi:hypothetical protein
MTSKFEQLIEYVINDEEAKAKELFHDIVVEKSREIYENLMNEEESEEELDEAAEEELDEAAEEELDENTMGDEEELDENMGMEEELMTDVDAEEQGMSEESDAEFDDEAEEDGEEMTHDMEAGHDEEGNIEDRVVDLEDKLDELMAEFESLMGNDGVESDLAGEEGDEVEGDALAADDTMAFADEGQMMEEGIELTKVAPAKMGDDGANTKSPVAANSGAAGMASKPVTTTGAEAKGRPAPTAGSISNEKFQNAPASGSKKLSPATKPHLAQAAGVNTKTPFPKG